MVARLRSKTEIPLVAMTYFNLILHYGPSRFIHDALNAGFDGVIIPDLHPEEEKDFSKQARQKGLQVILFLAPTTSPGRARFIVRRASGFIYFVSLTGVTGARKNLPRELQSQLIQVKKIAGRIPVVAGFGVSTPQQVRFVSSVCDGVIVGSAIVKKISECRAHAGLIKTVAHFAKRLKGGI